MPEPRLRRSMLMTPGNRPERLARAARCGADALVFDLEDPGLTDPQRNGYLAWAPPPVVVPVVEDLAARAAAAGGLALAGGAVLVATVSARGRRLTSRAAP